MRRVGKCIGKQVFSNKESALQVCYKRFVATNQVLGVYECPTCLDFHLTSKYCNIEEHYTNWRQEIKEAQEEKDLILKKATDPARDQLRRRRARLRANRKRNKRERERERPTNDQLTLAQQKEIFANFKPNCA